MSLRINRTRHILYRIFIICLIFFCTGMITKLYLWEQQYYKVMSVKPRNIGSSSSTSSDVDETERSDADKNAYKVCQTCPRFLTIKKLSINKALIRPVGLTQNNAMDTLPNIFDIAWYNKSGTPGSGKPILINAHNGGPTKSGVFGKLDTLKVNDIVHIERGDGKHFDYRIVESQIMPLSQANNYMATMLQSPQAGVESLSMISCAGNYSEQQKTFTDRAMLRAVLIERNQN